MNKDKLRKHVTDILRWVFGVAITLIYASIVILMIKTIGKFAQSIDSTEFHLDSFFFFAGCALFAFGCALLCWIYLIVLYQRSFDRIKDIIINVQITPQKEEKMVASQLTIPTKRKSDLHEDL